MEQGEVTGGRPMYQTIEGWEGWLLQERSLEERRRSEMIDWKERKKTQEMERKLWRLEDVEQATRGPAIEGSR